MNGHKTLLTTTAELLSRIPLPLLVVGHTLTVCAWFKRAHGDRYLINYWVSFLAAFGGGVATALLLQAPSLAGIGLLTKNELGIWWTITWWGMNYCPGDVVARVHSLLPVKAAARACLSTLRSAMIVHRVNAAVALFPGVVAAPLVIGTLSGSGGRILSDAFQISLGFSKGPSELSQPGYSIRSAFMATLATYSLVHVLRVLSEEECLALITSLLVAHALAAELTGRPLDFTEPFAQLFHKVTLIPMPGKPRGKPRGAKGKAVVSNPATPTPSATKQVAKGYGDDDPSMAGRNAATPGRVTRRRAAAVAGSD